MIKAHTTLALHRTMALAAALVALVAATGCSESAPAAPMTPAAATAGAGLPDRDPALARELVDKEHAVLLDVRTPGEFAGGALPNAVNIPVDDFRARLAEVDKLTGGDKHHAIVVYCHSGRRATAAKAMLLDAGYERVTNLGGMTDWR